MNEILEEDVLRGCKTIAAETRDGQTVDVNCRALSWAASCKVMSLADPAEAMLHAILNGVDADQAKDEFLNQLTPMGMVAVSNTVLTLTHGINALKKPGGEKQRAAGYADFHAAATEQRVHPFSGGKVAGFSPAQLTWHLRQVRRRTAERDQRTLLLLSASAAGGKAAEKVWRMLARERKELGGETEAEAKPESGTPLNQADFERMLKDEG